MKAIFYSFVVLMLFTSATCRKNQPGTSLEKQLIGAWKYNGKSGGYAGKSEKANPAMNYIIEFKSDFRYIQKTNNQIAGEGTYELNMVKSIYSGKKDNAIRFIPTANNSNKNSIISLRNDTLFISDNFYDGFKMEYIRVK